MTERSRAWKLVKLLRRRRVLEIAPCPWAEVHTVGRAGHVLCNQSGLNCLREVLPAKAGPAPFEFGADLGYFSGWPIYVDECPCSKATA